MARFQSTNTGGHCPNMAVGEDGQSGPRPKRNHVHFQLPASILGSSCGNTNTKQDLVQNDLSQQPAAEQCHAHGQGQGQGQPQLTPAMDGADPANVKAAVADTPVNSNMNSVDMNKSTGSDLEVGPAKVVVKDLLDTEDTDSKGRHSSGTSSDGKKGAIEQTTAADAAKQKEKEERLKHAKQRAAHDREKKIIDLKEAQRKAQEYRRKQEEDRRRKLEEMRRKEESHRSVVEERRKKLLEEDTSRKQMIIRRSVERDTKLDNIRSSRRSTATPPMRPKSSHSSDLAMSASSDGSPIRRPRPHSVAGRLPSYASPTVASQIRTSRSTEKKSSGNHTVCYRFRSVSPGPKMRSKSADYRRSRADIQRTFERLSTPRVKPKDASLDTSKSSHAPPKATPTPPRPMVPRTLPKDSSVTKPTAASANKGVTPTKGPVKAVHIKLDNQNDKPKTPIGKESSPLRERARSREGSATRDKPAEKNKAPPKEKPAPKEKVAPKENKPKPQPPKVKAPTPTTEKAPTKPAATNKQATPAKDKKDKPSKDAAASKAMPAKPGKVESKPKPKDTAKPKPAKEEPVTKKKKVPTATLR